MKLSYITFTLMGFIFVLIIFLVFNTHVNTLIELSTSTEIQTLLKATWFVLLIIMGLIYPIGLGKPDTQVNT